MNIDIPDPISDELKKSLESSKRLSEAVKAELDKNPVRESIKAVAMSFQKYEIAHPIIANIKQMQLASPLTEIAENFSCYKFNPDVTVALEAMNSAALKSVSASVESVAARLSEALINAVHSPFIEWISAIDYSPLQRMLESLQFSNEVVEKYKKLKDAYLQAMYDCDWFPYAGWIADISLFQKINKILATSRGKSKRRTARIDKAILSYYTPKEIKAIKRSWRRSYLEPYIKKMLSNAIDAHLRGEYALTISCLATMWEGLLKAKMPIKKRNKDELKKDIKVLVNDNGYEEILGDFYNNLIIHTCYSVDDVKEGVPNRHGVAHSWYKKYPNQKASLNAILLTDFIIGLTPKEISEEKRYGQDEDAHAE